MRKHTVHNFNTYNLYVYIECECSTFVDKNGYGRCFRRDVHFHVLSKNEIDAEVNKLYPFTCYIDETSFCSDAKNSTTTKVPGKQKSALACHGKHSILMLNLIENYI